MPSKLKKQRRSFTSRRNDTSKKIPSKSVKAAKTKPTPKLPPPSDPGYSQTYLDSLSKENFEKLRKNLGSRGESLKQTPKGASDPYLEGILAKPPSQPISAAPSTPTVTGVTTISTAPVLPKGGVPNAAPISTDPLALPSSLPASGLEAKKAITELAARANLLAITDDASFATAGEMLTQLKALSTRWENERKKLTAPLKEQAKRIEALFKPTEMQLEMMTKSLKDRSLKFYQMREAAQKAEQSKLLQAAQTAQESGDHESALALSTQSTEVIVSPKTTLLSTGSVQMKDVWTFEVVDLGKVPREYMSLDEAKVRAAIRAEMRDVTNEAGEVIHSAIPGIRIFQKPQVAVGAAPLL